MIEPRKQNWNSCILNGRILFPTVAKNIVHVPIYLSLSLSLSGFLELKVFQIQKTCSWFKQKVSAGNQLLTTVQWMWKIWSFWCGKLWWVKFKQSGFKIKRKTVAKLIWWQYTQSESHSVSQSSIITNGRSVYWMQNLYTVYRTTFNFKEKNKTKWHVLKTLTETVLIWYSTFIHKRPRLILFDDIEKFEAFQIK